MLFFIFLFATFFDVVVESCVICGRGQGQDVIQVRKSVGVARGYGEFITSRHFVDVDL